MRNHLVLGWAWYAKPRIIGSLFHHVDVVNNDFCALALKAKQATQQNVEKHVEMAPENAHNSDGPCVAIQRRAQGGF